MPKRPLFVTTTLALSLFAAGCDLSKLFGDEGDSSAEGTNAERFAVEGTMDENTCGSGSLALSNTWSFEIALERSGDTLYWNDSPVSLSDDGLTFSAQAQAFFDVRGKEDSYLPPCTIVRTDRVEARLDSEDDPTGFEGTFELSYDPTDGSDCSDLLEGPERLAGFLPCSALYAIEGKRR